MDFVNILTKLEKIENKQILTESEDRPAAKKKETTWTDKSGKQHSATRVQGSKSVAADKEADKERKKHDKDLDESMFRTELGKSLVKEFGYDLTEAENPWTNDPEKSAAWSKLSPEDQKWLGGADPTDPYILARAPNKGKPAATPAPVAQDDATGVDAAVAAQQAASGPTDDEIAANNAALAGFDADVGGGAGSSANPPTGQAAEEPKTIDPNKVKRFKELLAKAEAGKAKPDTAAEPAPAAAPAPAAGPAAQAAAPAATTKPGSSANPPAAGGSYTIKPGDTLTKIAKDNGTSIDAIMKANPQIKDPNKISAGAKLNLPGRGANPPAATPLPGKPVQGGGNISDTPAAESLSEDDRILNAIRSLSYR